MKTKILFFLLITILSSCSTKEIIEYSFVGTTMGTSYSVKIIEVKNKALENVKAKVDSILVDVNNNMSTYIPNSELSKFNSYNDTTWFSTSKELVQLFSEAIEISNLTNKSFDITIGQLVNLWGFGPTRNKNKIPTTKEINILLRDTGIDKIKIHIKNQNIKKLESKLYCDLSAIAKGYGVDKLAEYFDKLKFNNYMIEIGGEVRTKGTNLKKDKWKIGISSPNNNNLEAIIELSNYSMATSGDYLNYFEKDGYRYSHTIDPRTGKPITHNLASVTVISENCRYADALATAINVMGPEEGYNFALQENLPIFMIVREKNNFVEKMTVQFSKFIFKN